MPRIKSVFICICHVTVVWTIMSWGCTNTLKQLLQNIMRNHCDISARVLCPTGKNYNVVALVLTHIRFQSFCKWVNKTIAVLAVISVSSLDISQGSHTYKWKQKKKTNYIDCQLCYPRKQIQVSLVRGGVFISPNVSLKRQKKTPKCPHFGPGLSQALMTLGYAHGHSGSVLHFHQFRCL